MELVERERYLADLAKWLSAATERGGCVALVGGEAGIGKTALLQEFSLRQRAARLLWGACDALFTPRPLAPLHARSMLAVSYRDDAARESPSQVRMSGCRPSSRHPRCNIVGTVKSSIFLRDRLAKALASTRIED
jgi:predicted ATPase